MIFRSNTEKSIVKMKLWESANLKVRSAAEPEIEIKQCERLASASFRHASSDPAQWHTS